MSLRDPSFSQSLNPNLMDSERALGFPGALRRAVYALKKQMGDIYV